MSVSVSADNALGQTFVSIERGRFDPSLPLAFHITRVFDCAIEDVFTPVAME